MYLNMTAFYVAQTAPSGSTGSPSVAWPTHEIYDVAFLLCESTGGQAVTLGTPNGFAAVTGSPQNTGLGTSGTRLSVFWNRATSTSMAAPVVTGPGNHVITAMVTYRGCITTGNPWNTTTGATKISTSTSCTHPAVTTTVDDARILILASRDLGGGAGNLWNGTYTNSNLTNITERVNDGGAAGNAGGLLCVDGIMPVKGNTGTTASTMLASQFNGYLTVALTPEKGSFFGMM